MVVYNAIEQNRGFPASMPQYSRRQEKIVLFLGRITMQKGPEYFLEAAKRVLEVAGNVRFIMAGSGNMTHQMIEKAAVSSVVLQKQLTAFASHLHAIWLALRGEIHIDPEIATMTY